MLTLRPYQVEAVEAVHEALHMHRAALCVLSTGLGKTVCAAKIIHDVYQTGGQSMFLVDADELVWQAAERLRADADLPVDIEKANRRAQTWAPVVVASIQSLRRPGRLICWHPDTFKLIVADEAHKSFSPGYELVFKHFASARICGLTATPERTDCKSLREVYTDVAYEMGLRKAVEDGWLVPVRSRLVRVEDLDYSKIRRISDEKLEGGDVEEILLQAKMLRLMAEATVHQSGERQALVFAAGVKQALAFADALRSLGLDAEFIEGETPKKRRREIIAAYKRGDVQVLTNCQCLGEGFDAPPTSAIVYARPIVAGRLYRQIAGRGLRPLAGVVDGPLTAWDRRQAIASSKKPDCILIDFCGNAGRHRLVRAAAALEPDTDEDVAAKAEELVLQNGQLTMHEALGLAEIMVAKLREEAANRERIRPAYDYDETDPLAGQVGIVFGMFGLSRIPDRWEREPSAAQLGALGRMGLADPAGMNRLEASALLDVLVSRAKKGLSTLRQIDLLVRRGGTPVCNAVAMSFERASHGLTELRANHWRRPVHWGEPTDFRFRADPNSSPETSP